MKNTLYILLLGTLIFSCNSVKKDDVSTVDQAFKANSETMQTLLNSFANESVDYSYFSDDVVFKGTVLGSPDSLRLDQVKEIHKQFFAKYVLHHI